MPAASVRAVVAAVGFLTRVPVGRAVAVQAPDVARGAVLFPAVGAGIGALAGLTAAALEGPLPPTLAGGVAVAVALALTGGLHLDALADAADALGRPRAEALRIMADPRIGAFGAAAVALVVLLEAVSAGSLAHGGDALAAFACAGALSRAACLPAALALPYARASDGTGGVLSGRLAAPAVVAAASSAAGLSVLLLGRDGAIAAGAAAAVAGASALAARAWLGGVTGDLLGATTQVAEVAVLVLLVGLR